MNMSDTIFVVVKTEDDRGNTAWYPVASTSSVHVAEKEANEYLDEYNLATVYIVKGVCKATLKTTTKVEFETVWED